MPESAEPIPLFQGRSKKDTVTDVLDHIKNWIQELSYFYWHLFILIR